MASSIWILIAVGLVAGMLSGLVGIGGGIIIVPVLVYMLGLSQHAAQGTTLFMFLLPIGVLGVYNYYAAGNVDWKTACIMALPFMLGSFLGSKWALQLDQSTIKKVFAVILILLGIKMLWGK